MKKVFIALAGLMILSLTACAVKEEAPPQRELLSDQEESLMLESMPLIVPGQAAKETCVYAAIYGK